MSTTETPAEKTMRRFYEGSLAERLMQAASMERNRQLLRRGALKQQDGTLGQPAGDGAGEGDDDVHIHIGDIHSSQQQAPVAEQPSPLPQEAGGWTDFAKKAAVAAALLAGGGAIGYALSPDQQPEQQPSPDTWIEYDGQKFTPQE